MLNRRGMTFLETIVAVAIIGMLAAAVTSAISFIGNTQRRQQRQLEAAEIAHRLILQYIDDPDEMPKPTETIGPINGDVFRYEQSLEPVAVSSAIDTSITNDSRSNNSSSQGAGAAGGISLDRLGVVRIRVWLAEPSGGTRVFDPSMPGAVLARLYDPLASITRPDTGQKIISNQDRLQQMMNQIGGGRGGR